VVGLHGDLLLRIVVATGLGASIGYERQVHGRPAGLRTHVLVALASATFMIVSSHFVYFQHYARNDLVAVDPSRIAASVVTGTGFLAGGAILRTGLTVQGLTTGAGLWLVSSIGLSAGGGMYLESAAATGIGLVALTVLRRLERKDDRTVRRRVSLEFGQTDAATPLTAILTTIPSLGGVVTDAHYDREILQGHMTATLDVRLPADLGPAALLNAFDGLSGLRRIRIEPPA
jgi:putative Mg2+ transporter-C (MgtC) family protein